MRRSDRKRGDGLDPQRVVAAAVEAFLASDSGGRRAEADEEHARRRVGGGTLALGVVLGIGARALYGRARKLDLVQVARAVEQRIVN
jgi:hypothetical protein